MDARRLAIRDSAGQIIKLLDISDVDHANSQAAMTAEIQTRCDYGDWHSGQSLILVPWGRAIKNPYA